MSNEAEFIRHILDSHRVARDGVLIVHSSFSGFSRLGLRAERVCDALIHEMRDGTVLMPTMTWRTVNPQNPLFDELKTPSATGVLTEIFRTQYATHRSLHPTHSVAGIGPAAPFLLATHHEGTTPCAGNSPYGLIRDHDGFILILGLGLEVCTAVHHAEEIVAPDLYLRPMAQAEEYLLVDRRGTMQKAVTRRHHRLPRDFQKFEPILKARGMLSHGLFGNNRWLLFSSRDLYKTLFSALVVNREATLITSETRG